MVTIAWSLIGVASVVGFVLMLLPTHKVSIERRRIGTDAHGSGVSRAANAATGAVEKFLAGRGNSFSAILEEAGVTIPLKELVVIVFSACMALFAIGLVMGQPLLGLLMALVTPVLARLWLSMLAGRRRAKFESQLDETLQMIAGSLRAGYSLPQAMGTIGQEGSPPTSLEFARVTNEVRVGRSLNEALSDVCDRMRNEDFFWVTQAISINREVGGNLADVLDGVSKTIRQRAEIRGQVKSLAADGQLSAVIMIALPFAVAGFLAIASPKYISQLVADPIGWAMIGAGLVMMTIGTLWMYKMIDLKF
ncbi:type II secretion system F family protein [Propionicimonas sp.]|uniref:type II secretion system F family protein n=1 Tax=Propionicimonas sp. TaxID=1955623 RepID=UPI0025DCFDF2|nr:type II secretion system F family protein [Propionicimonas sp.]